MQRGTPSEVAAETKYLLTQIHLAVSPMVTAKEVQGFCEIASFSSRVLCMLYTDAVFLCRVRGPCV